MTSLEESACIKEFKKPWPWTEKYLDNCPKSRALIVVHEGIAKILDFIGACLDYIDEEGMLSDYFESEVGGVNSGVYIWDGSIHFDKTYCYDYGCYEYDEWLEGDLRLATKEEWKAYINDEYVWDRSLWLKQEFLVGEW